MEDFHAGKDEVKKLNKKADNLDAAESYVKSLGEKPDQGLTHEQLARDEAEVLGKMKGLADKFQDDFKKGKLTQVQLSDLLDDLGAVNHFMQYNIVGFSHFEVDDSVKQKRTADLPSFLSEQGVRITRIRLEDGTTTDSLTLPLAYPDGKPHFHAAFIPGMDSEGAYYTSVEVHDFAGGKMIKLKTSIGEVADFIIAPDNSVTYRQSGPNGVSEQGKLRYTGKFPKPERERPVPVAPVDVKADAPTSQEEDAPEAKVQLEANGMPKGFAKPIIERGPGGERFIRVDKPFTTPGGLQVKINEFQNPDGWVCVGVDILNPGALSREFMDAAVLKEGWRDSVVNANDQNMVDSLAGRYHTYEQADLALQNLQSFVNQSNGEYATDYKRYNKFLKGKLAKLKADIAKYTKGKDILR